MPEVEPDVPVVEFDVPTVEFDVSTLEYTDKAIPVFNAVKSIVTSEEFEELDIFNIFLTEAKSESCSISPAVTCVFVAINLLLYYIELKVVYIIEFTITSRECKQANIFLTLYI